MSGRLKRLGTFACLPPSGANQSIGLLGGSFNPAHDGHLHISLTALKRLGLDAVWWLVSPGNPLKDHTELLGLDRRVEQARRIANHPRIHVSSLEAEIGLSRTRDVIAFLKRRAPHLRFVWLMGADNLAQFHRWHAWQDIAASIPMGIIDRPGWHLAALSSPAALRFARDRIDEGDASSLPDLAPPAWVFLHGPRSALSSTALRQAEHS